MKAEIYGKLDIERSTPAERAEDLLTDYVFTTLRQIDRSLGLGPLLKMAFPSLSWSVGELADAKFLFWPRFQDGTEPDLVILVGLRPVIVEAKYRSGFGVGESAERAQLVREYVAGVEWARVRRFVTPTVLALTDDLAIPDVVEEARRTLWRSFGVPISADVVSWASWQQVGQLLDSNESLLSKREAELVGDLLEVMERKGVRYVFQGFKPEDYWIVSAAERIAAERVYPAIAVFVRELLSQLADQAITRATGDSRLTTRRSESLSQPEKWGVSYLFLPLRSDEWTTPSDWNNRYLFVQFALDEPVLAAGFRLRIKPARMPLIRDQAREWVAALRAFGPDYSVRTVKYPDFHRSTDEISAADVTAEFLQRNLEGAEVQLQVDRRLPLSLLESSLTVVEMVVEAKGLVERSGLLRMSEHLEGS